MKKQSKLFDRRLKLPKSIFTDSISNDIEPVICANSMAGIEGQDNLTSEDVVSLIGGRILDYNQSENKFYRG